MRAFAKDASLLKSAFPPVWFLQMGVPSLAIWLEARLAGVAFLLPGTFGPRYPQLLSGSTFGVRSTTDESAKIITFCAPTYGVSTALSARTIGFESCASNPTDVR